MTGRAESRPEAEEALERATLAKLIELLEARSWPHRFEYLAEVEAGSERWPGLARSDVAARVLASHAAWQPEVHPIREEAQAAVESKHPEWVREAVDAKLETVATEAGLSDAARERYAERTARRLRDLPYVDALPGASHRFSPPAEGHAVHSHFRAQDFIEGAWWELWGELEEDEKGLPVIRRLLIEPHPHMQPPGKELAPGALRQLRLPLIRERALRELHEGDAYAASGLEARARDLVAQLRESPPRQGRTGYPDELFELVALHYVRLKRKHGTYRLTRRLACLEGRLLQRSIASGTIKDWVREAARRGYLEKGPASWELGPKLYSNTTERQGREQ